MHPDREERQAACPPRRGPEERKQCTARPKLGNRVVNCICEEFRARAALLRDGQPSRGARRVPLPHPRLAARRADAGDPVRGRHHRGRAWRAAGPARHRQGDRRPTREPVTDIDILVTSTDPARVIETLVSLPSVAEVTARGDTKVSVRHQDGLAIDLRVVAPEAFGAALQYFTGSKAHNVRLREMAVRRGLKISEYGVFDEATGARVAGETEEDVYAAVGLPWIPPELREDGGEIDAAREGRLPALVERAHLRGDLHDHTEWSDGHHPLERLVEAAQARGYEYVIVSDHSRSLTIAQGLSVERLRQQRAEIRAVQARHTIRILAGSECDILEDGRLDFPDEVLAELDVVVASVHSRFKQERATMTARIVRALENPHVDILGHPTGRRLGSREPYDVDLDAVFAAARAPGKAVEINASPERLDLNDVHARRAAEAGVPLSIRTDTHYLSELDNVDLGVAVARRAWLGREQILNTRSLDDLLAWTRRG